MIHIHDFKASSELCVLCYPNGEIDRTSWYFFGGQRSGKTQAFYNAMNPYYTGPRRSEQSFIDVKFKVVA